MSEQLTLPAETRERAGKGASRDLRNSGRVPAVIYGANQEPLSIHVEEKLLTKMLSTGHFMNTVVMIDAGGSTTRTLPKDVQFHPVSSRPVHVDFLRISEHSKVTVNVPVRFTDEEESPGIKRGAVLNIVKDDIEVSLKGLDVGDSIHISNVTLPKGATPTITDRDFTIATMVAPGSMKSDAGDAAEDAAAEAEAE
jgi:large subunit ribosomal protein L25